MTTSQSPRLEIVIDELVIRGLTPQAAGIAAASLEARLTALAEGHEAPIPARTEAFRRLPTIEAAADSPAAVGAAAAGAVWNELAGGARR
jgi:hypothetical protein